jgi:hypothetical protein
LSERPWSDCIKQRFQAVAQFISFASRVRFDVLKQYQPQMDADGRKYVRSLNAITAPIGEPKAVTASICVHLRLIFLIS